MAKQNRGAKQAGERRGKHGKLELVSADGYMPIAPTKPSTEPFGPRTEAQGRMIESIRKNAVTFGVGPAGTGKTYVPLAMACEMLLEGKIRRIVLTRPAVSVDEEWAAVPGDIDEKYMPYLMPFLDILEERLGHGHLEMFLKDRKIVPRPLGLMRGMTLKDCVVILDEAQNTTPKQMKMFMTRLGPGCVMVINGDVTQKDIRGTSGLYDAVGRFYHRRQFGLVQFSKEDVVRHGLIQDIVDAYDEEPIGSNPLD